jgi:arsenate reductase-like glutaredoxin family protein
MISEIKDMKTWEEAERWLRKHGYGPGSIDLLKIEWDDSRIVKANTASVSKETITTAIEESKKEVVRKVSASKTAVL